MLTLAISTPRLMIRNLRLSDVPDFHAYRSNPEVTRYQGFDVMDAAQAEAFIDTQADKQYGRPGEWVQYGIEAAATGRLVGDCAIRLDAPDGQTAEIGITVSHLQQRQGYAKEAMRGLLDFLFRDQHLHRVVETVDADNEASIQLLRSVGFRQEGHFVENIFFKGA